MTRNFHVFLWHPRLREYADFVVAEQDEEYAIEAAREEAVAVYPGTDSDEWRLRHVTWLPKEAFGE